MSCFSRFIPSLHVCEVELLSIVFVASTFGPGTVQTISPSSSLQIEPSFLARLDRDRQNSLALLALCLGSSSILGFF